MNNYLLITIALLEKAKIYTEEEAKGLAKELTSSTLPDTYKATSLLIDEIHKKLKINLHS